MKWKFFVKTLNNVNVRYSHEYDTYVEAVDMALALADDPNYLKVELLIIMKDYER